MMYVCMYYSDTVDLHVSTAVQYVCHVCMYVCMYVQYVCVPVQYNVCIHSDNTVGITLLGYIRAQYNILI